MKKLIVMFLAGLALCIPAAAQNFSDNVSLESSEGDIVAIKASASHAKKKEAETLAIKSAFNAIFHSGVEGLKNGQPMIVGDSKSYDYRFFNENRYIQYMTQEPKKLNSDKIKGNSLTTVVVYINLKSLKAELQRNKLTISPAWADAKAVSATASLNPTIVVAPYTTAETGYSFESMRSILEKDPIQRYAVDRVAEEFQKHGFKTRDLVSQLQNAKTSAFLREGTQTDDESMVVSQLPGDIIVYVDCFINSLGDGKSAATLNIHALEKQTNGRLATKAFGSSGFYTNEHMPLVNNAVESITADFFSQLHDSFDEMVRKGREVSMELSLAESVDWDFDCDAPASGEFFKDALEEWLRENSFQSVYNLNSSDKYIVISVNVPLWDMEKNRSFTLTNFSSNFRKFLKSQLGDEYKPKITTMGQKIDVKIE
ncbi:MAG: hypothetical protein K2I56_06505 [Muribaculaceae bacterium]|nr:hypothetical protein [Muribaculaceae bacterium]